MPRLAALAHLLWHGRYFVAYVALATAGLAQLRHFHHPQTGFTSLIRFGSHFAPRWVPEMSHAAVYTYADSDGYDAQFYAQLAVAGNPLSPPLQKALDSAPYRTRRALLPFLAYLAGLGQPAWVLQVYALANAICWAVLAFLLARWWFPPDSLANLLRWGGVMFGEGMLTSLTHALTDGPALLVLACGLRALETNRHRIAAGLLAAAGLVRETSVLAAAAFLPVTADQRRAWRRNLGLAAACVAPTVVWMAALALHYREAGGARNFDVPFASIAAKGREIHEIWTRNGWDEMARHHLWVVLSLLVQASFVLARPRPGHAIWRVGAAFALLCLLLGPAVWEGIAAAPRAVLPLTLAFNLLVPRRRWALVLLVVGNLTVLSAASNLRPFRSEQTIFPHRVTMAYAEGWHGSESDPGRTWRWASGPATLVIRNADPAPHEVTLSFRLVSVEDREVRIRWPSGDRSLPVRGGAKGVPVRLGPFTVAPGETPVSFSSASPSWIEPGPARRPLAFGVESFYADVSAAAR